MNENEQLIHHFYTSFQQKNVAGMQSCYADEATFSDAVFNTLNAYETKAMWAMLVEKGKDLELRFSDVHADATSGSAKWVATYTFSVSGNKVINVINAHFNFKNGKILIHRDDFSFYKWAGQALGLTGKLLGWTPFLKKKIRSTALRNLKAYMASHPQTL